MAVPADYFKQTEDEFNAYTKTLDPSDEAYGMTFEQFIDALLSAQIESVTSSVQSIKISVADLVRLQEQAHSGSEADVCKLRRYRKGIYR